MRRPALAALVLILGALLGVAPAQGADAKVTPAEVKRAIERGKAALTRSLGALRRGRADGYRILVLMALLNCGVKPDDPAVKEDLQDLAKRSDTISVDPLRYQGVYVSGLLLALFQMTEDPRYQSHAVALARRLQHYQEGNGGWGDNSRTQFALLGLKAAEDMGVEIPEKVFENARRFAESGQGRDGGWGYRPDFRQNSYGSMTVAGISSLYICGARLYRSTSVCGQGASDKRLAQGMEWLANNFSVRANPGTQGWGHHFYYLYGLERIGVLMAQKTIGGHDWYREGAEYLVSTQAADGTWGRDMLSTAFALLFLGKGSQPIAIQKLRHDGDWNPDPYDAKHLAERAAKDLETPMTWQVVGTHAKAEDLAAAPILYLQGHKAFEFGPGFLDALRAFVDHGGFVIASACCGSEDFADAFRAEMRKAYPDGAFERLPASHAVYHLRHAVTAREAIMLEGLNTGCRTSVFLAPHDLCCAWGACKGCKGNCVHGDEALKLGVNLVAYALGYQKLRDKLEEVKLDLQATAADVERGALVIGQLYHTGDWDPDPASIPNLAQTLKEQLGVRGRTAKRRVVLGTDDPGEYPILYLTGHNAFAYSPAQVAALREYLERGGFLLADPCCGKAAFDLAFQKLCEQLYPGRELERLPADHAILSAPYRIEQVKYKTAVKRFFPELRDEPHLEGLILKGRVAVLYSRFNLGCELQGHACGNCIGIEGHDAYKIAVNAIMYALSR